MSKKSAPPPKENPNYRPQAASSTPTYLLIGLGLLVAALVIGGFVWNANKTYPPVDDAVLAENASFIVGERTAPLTVDVFEDFGCSHCKDFEAQSGNAMDAAVSAGKMRVRYHLLTFQDKNSPSGNYSSRAAGAVLCVARNGGDARVFNKLHAELFAKAPGQGADGDLTNAQMAELATTAGANEQVRGCIADGALVGQAIEMGKTSETQLANSNKGQIATPTVLVAGKQVDGIMNGDEWVGKLLAGDRPE